MRMMALLVTLVATTWAAAQTTQPAGAQPEPRDTPVARQDDGAERPRRIPQRWRQAQRVADVAAPRRPRGVRQMLGQRLPEVRFEEVPLEQVFEQLAVLANTNIIVRWRALADYGIDRQFPVSLTVRNLRLETVLHLVLDQAGGMEVQLAYRASREFILVSTKAEFSRQMIIRIYPIKDLIMERIEHTEMFIGSTSQYIAGLEPVVGEGAAAARPIVEEINAGVGLWGNPRQSDPWEDLERGRRDRDDRTDVEQENLEELINVIHVSIEPDHWDVNGGPGSIRPFGDQLIIRASPLVHQMIGGPIRTTGGQP